MNENQLFKPVEQKRVFEDIANQIREAILSKKLKAQDRLPSERELAEQFKVGRLTIREALRTLESKGFVKVKKGSGGGAFVGEGDPGMVASLIIDNLQLEGLTGDQITESRITLECAGIRMAIKNAGMDDLDRVAESIEATREILKPERAGEILAKMVEFHILVAKASHNLPYVLFVRSLMEWGLRMRKNWIPTAEEQAYSYQSHLDIFRSISSKDEKKAMALMEEHIICMGSLGPNSIKM